MKIRKAIKGLAYKGLLNWMPDKQYLEILYRASMGEKLNLSNPKKFNEKIRFIEKFMIL